MQIIKGLVELGHTVAIYPVIDEIGAGVSGEPPIGAHILRGWSGTRLADLVRERGRNTDIVWISRIHNIVHVEATLAAFGTSLRDLSDAALVYDAEAIVALREGTRALVSRKPVLGSQVLASVKRETDRFRAADRVVCVSRREQQIFADLDIRNTIVLGHALNIEDVGPGFEDRNGIVMIGNLLSKGSPNHVSTEWFLRCVWPLVRSRPLGPKHLTIVGPLNADIAANFAQADVQFLGRVPDLAPVVNRARVAVAPTRFASGVPHKVHEAMSRGLPIVITRLLADQLESTEAPLAVADDPRSFADLVCTLHGDEVAWTSTREAGLRLIEANCSRLKFLDELRVICQTEAAVSRG